MNGPRGYYTKWNKTDRQILCDFIYMWVYIQNKWTNIAGRYIERASRWLLERRAMEKWKGKKVTIWGS